MAISADPDQTASMIRIFPVLLFLQAFLNSSPDNLAGIEKCLKFKNIYNALLILQTEKQYYGLKTQMKFCVAQHLSGSALFTETKAIFSGKNSLELIPCDPFKYIMDHPILILLLCMIESISIEKVKKYFFKQHLQ